MLLADVGWREKDAAMSEAKSRSLRAKREKEMLHLALAVASLQPSRPLITFLPEGIFCRRNHTWRGVRGDGNIMFIGREYEW